MKTGCVTGVLGLLLGGVIFITIGSVFFGVMAGIGDAVLPEQYQDTYKAWLEGAPTDDPAFEVVADSVSAYLPCLPSEMTWPVVDTGFFTQPFIEGEHAGVDIGLPVGTPVGSPADGVVVWSGWDSSGYGNLVIVANGDTRFYLAHLSEVLVEPGQQVSAEETLGLSGNTGLSTGPHLHFEVRVGGVAVDPFMINNVCTEIASTGGRGGGAFQQETPVVQWQLPYGMRGYALRALLNPSPKPGAALVQTAWADGTLYVWPDGRPDLAQAGGASFRNVSATMFGPQPGDVWGMLSIEADNEYLISVWSQP